MSAAPKLVKTRRDSAPPDWWKPEQPDSDPRPLTSERSAMALAIAILMHGKNCAEWRNAREHTRDWAMELIRKAGRDVPE